VLDICIQFKYNIYKNHITFIHLREVYYEEGDYKFHITSLKPLNPNNTPDEFEKKALMFFEKGEKESFVTEKKGDKSIFRYMAPLFVEKSCLGCHAKQGYKLEEVRGGIS